MAAIAAGFGITHLVLALTGAAPAYREMSRASASFAAGTRAAGKADPGPWPLLFGRVEPQPPKPAAPPQPPAPPLSSLGYTLRGVIVNDGQSWAIITHPSGDRIVKVGDTLTAGIKVAAIDDTGLVLATSHGTERLDFAK